MTEPGRQAADSISMIATGERECINLCQPISSKHSDLAMDARSRAGYELNMNQNDRQNTYDKDRPITKGRLQHV